MEEEGGGRGWCGCGEREMREGMERMATESGRNRGVNRGHVGCAETKGT